MDYQLNDKEENYVAQDNVEESWECREYLVQITIVVEVVQRLLVTPFHDADLRSKDAKPTCI